MALAQPPSANLEIAGQQQTTARHDAPFKAASEHHESDMVRPSTMYSTAGQHLEGNHLDHNASLAINATAQQTSAAIQKSKTASTNPAEDIVMQYAGDHATTQPSVQASRPAITTTTPTQAIMPPPVAPRSLLPRLEACRIDQGKRITDPHVVRRLVSVCVILFRQGDAVAKELGEYTIALIGKGLWDEELEEFLNSPPEANDSQAVNVLLREALANLYEMNRQSATFLSGMLYAWRWFEGQGQGPL